MVVFIDLEHERLRKTPLLWQFFSAKTLQTKYRLESISKAHCLIVHHRCITPAVMERLNPWAVVVGGNYTGFQHFDEADLAGVRAFLIEGSRPTLAICGGFQLLVQAHGGMIGPLERENGGSKDPSKDTDTPMPPELFDHDETVHTLDENEEIGFTPVWVDRAHSIFDGLNERALFYQLHGGEVKRLPSGFSKIAESHRCKIQAIVHHRAPIFGTQFHPEAYNESYPDGKRILENFFRMANAFRHGQPAVRHKPERC